MGTVTTITSVAKNGRGSPYTMQRSVTRGGLYLSGGLGAGWNAAPYPRPGGFSSTSSRQLESFCLGAPADGH